MSSEIINWWKSLWSEQRVVAVALAGLIAALIMFIVRDAFWQTRITRKQRRLDLWRNQMDNFYSPLYLYYRQAFLRFDTWKRDNPKTQLQRQPFFEGSDDAKIDEKIFNENAGYASQRIIQLWTKSQSLSSKRERNTERKEMIEILVKEYQDLRRKLGLDYDQDELKTGEFRT
jgi:hypothetical protein